jgi:hypothetical protein
MFSHGFSSFVIYFSAEFDIPSRQDILKIRDFEQMQVSTLNLNVSRAGFYNVTGKDDFNA